MAARREFVMGDIHGAYRALLQCMERSGFNREKDVLIQLGDVVDGYPEVYECVEELMKIKHLIPIKGNHDDWLLQFIETDFHPYFWNLGGRGTLISYLKHCLPQGRYYATRSGFKTSLEAKNIPKSHKEFFRRQKLYHINDQGQCFVHAGFKRDKNFDKQLPADFYWDRTLWERTITLYADKKVRVDGEELGLEAKFKDIFIGHTSTTRWGKAEPMRAFNIHNIDTGAGHTGRLTIMDTETKEFWQSDPVVELYSESYRN